MHQGGRESFASGSMDSLPSVAKPNSDDESESQSLVSDVGHSEDEIAQPPAVAGAGSSSDAAPHHEERGSRGIKHQGLSARNTTSVLR